MIDITVNGEAKQIPKHTTIDTLRQSLGLKVEIMAVAVNMEIVKKDDWGSFELNQNDKVELLQFVGGG